VGGEPKSWASAHTDQGAAYRRRPLDPQALLLRASLVGRACFRGFRYPPQNVAA